MRRMLRQAHFSFQRFASFGAAAILSCGAPLFAAETAPRLWRERPPSERLPEFVPPTSLAPLVRAVSGSVVNVSTRSAEDAGSTEPDSLGSGFIISPNGDVVTHNHGVDKA